MLYVGEWSGLHGYDRIWGFWRNKYVNDIKKRLKEFCNRLCGKLKNLDFLLTDDFRTIDARTGIRLRNHTYPIMYLQYTYVCT